MPKSPQKLIQRLLSFWPAYGIYKRKSDYSGKDIISSFDEDCPYPIWHRQEWIEHANPPSADFDFTRQFYEQLWELFKISPIPHNIGLGNENCDYTDDWWHSKNCYLCHSGAHCEDLVYSYRTVRCRDSRYVVFCFDCELCQDCVNSHRCYNCSGCFYSRDCRDSAFLFDCRNCSDCLFCWNLRGKRYCFENKQLSKEEFEQIKKEIDLSSRATYDSMLTRFYENIKTKAWWRALQSEKCENSIGSYVENNKNCINCFFISECEDCVNATRCFGMRDTVDSVSVFDAERVFCSSMVQISCYDVRYSYNLFECRFCEYCAHCFNCKNCFACCGLVGKEFCILNKQYDEATYRELVAKIHAKIKLEGIEGEFFPPHFAAVVYNDSIASPHFPLSNEEQKNLGYRISKDANQKPSNALETFVIPDRSADTHDSIIEQVFWDDISKRPIRITQQDLLISKKQDWPLPHMFYLRRIRELYSWMFYDGRLRQTTCALTGNKIHTNLPPFLDGRILSDKAYLSEVL